MAFEAIFRAEGDKIDYTPSGADVAAGEVVDLGTCVGIASRKILDGQLGALQVEGIYEVAKTADEEIALGAPVYWDASENTATGTIGYSDAVMGKAVRASAAADTTVWVKLIF